MARISASVFTSHVPAIGVAIDQGKTQEAYWQPLFKGYEYSRQWMRDNRPDVIFLIYNGHGIQPGSHSHLCDRDRGRVLPRR